MTLLRLWIHVLLIQLLAQYSMVSKFGGETPNQHPHQHQGRRPLGRIMMASAFSASFHHHSHHRHHHPASSRHCESAICATFITTATTFASPLSSSFRDIGAVRRPPSQRYASAAASSRSQRTFTVQTSSGTALRSAISAVTTTTATTPLWQSSSSSVLVLDVYLRALGLVYLVAFAGALWQNKALIGDDGLTPARHVLDAATLRGQQRRRQRLQWRQRQWKNPIIRPWHRRFFFWLGKTLDRLPAWVRLREVLWERCDAQGRPVQPCLLWLARDRDNLDPVLDSIAQTGLALALFLLSKGGANVPILLGLWLCHRSLLAVGGPFYAYGWETQLSEVGYHAALLVPLWSLTSTPPLRMVVSPIVAWCLRWHLFRVMIGAGLIKLRSGDPKWRDLTTMQYFYETQPVPNPLSRYFHWMPVLWHKWEVLVNHAVELVAPWLLIIPFQFLPLYWRRATGLIQLGFQAVLICSGNLSFLNWLTMVPAILCLDDALLAPLFFPSLQPQSAAAAVASSGMYSYYSTISRTRQIVEWIFLALILKLSIPVVQNLCSRHQVMNQSYDPLRLVNTYGAFGTVSTVRDEWIISSSSSSSGEDGSGHDRQWREYHFKVKPGDVHQSPRFLSPYHHRLDWQMWLAATCRTVDHPNTAPWLFPFLLKLLQQDEAVLNDLMRGDPWKEESGNSTICCKPKYIRIDRYRYKFHRPQRGEKRPIPYWDREWIEQVYPRDGLGATVESLQQEIMVRSPKWRQQWQPPGQSSTDEVAPVDSSRRERSAGQEPPLNNTYTEQ